MKNSLRIIGGIWRGRKLPVLTKPGLRPTSGMQRERLFNWLNPYLHRATVLDAFSGSGALGFEAASRGAKSVLMLENDRAVAENLRAQKNILKADNVEVYLTDTLQFLNKTRDKTFDCIFLDPPFASSDLTKLLALIDKNEFCSQELGLIYLETERSSIFQAPPTWQPIKISYTKRLMYTLFQSGTRKLPLG